MGSLFEADRGSKKQCCIDVRGKLAAAYEDTLRELLAQQASYDVIQYNNNLFKEAISKIDEEMERLCSLASSAAEYLLKREQRGDE